MINLISYTAPCFRVSGLAPPTTISRVLGAVTGGQISRELVCGAAARNLKGLKSKSARPISVSCPSARLFLKCCVESHCDRAAICVIGSHLNKQQTSTDRLRTWSIPPLAALLTSTLLKTHTCAHLRLCPSFTWLINGLVLAFYVLLLAPLLWWICFDYIQKLLLNWSMPLCSDSTSSPMRAPVSPGLNGVWGARLSTRNNSCVQNMYIFSDKWQYPHKTLVCATQVSLEYFMHWVHVIYSQKKT